VACVTSEVELSASGRVLRREDGDQAPASEWQRETEKRRGRPGLEPFCTSLVLGMDPAPRISLFHVDRLFKDLAEATVAAAAMDAVAGAASAGVATLREASVGLQRLGLGQRLQAVLFSQPPPKQLPASASGAGEAKRDGTATTSDGKGGESGEGVQGRPADGTKASTKASEGGGGDGGQGTGDGSASAKAEAEPITEAGAGAAPVTAATAPEAAERFSEAAAARAVWAEEGREVEMIPPGVILHLDDEVASLGLGASAPSALAFEACALDYDRLPLSFSLMAYHLPQRYLAAILAAATIPMRAASPRASSHAFSASQTTSDAAGGVVGDGGSQTANSSRGDEAHELPGGCQGGAINEAQFTIRFEHMASAFDIARDDS